MDNFSKFQPYLIILLLLTLTFQKCNLLKQLFFYFRYWGHNFREELHFKNYCTV